MAFVFPIPNRSLKYKYFLSETWRKQGRILLVKIDMENHWLYQFIRKNHISARTKLNITDNDETESLK